MQFILTIMLTLTFGLSMLQCQQSTTTSKPEAAKTNTQTTTAAPDAKTNSAATEHTDEHGDDAPRINLADAKKDFDAGKVVFVDTRAAPSYNTEHIKGAINVPADSIQTRYTEVPKDKKVIAYCSWPAEHTSASLVQKLKEKGYTNAYALVGGTKAWKDAGFPMESGGQK